ncbi:MAG: GNAT family N-acetyltransferase [Natronomonas sp.]
MSDDREYPTEIPEPHEEPPVYFEDRAGRSIRIVRYAEDFEAIVEMYDAFDPRDRAQGIPPSSEPRIRRWLESLLVPECVNVVAWHDDDAIGHATLVPDDDGAHELAIFVLHSYQEAGIGTRLIEALLGAGRVDGVERVWLTVERWNDPAVSLYRKIGFETTGREGFELEMAVRLV